MKFSQLIFAAACYCALATQALASPLELPLCDDVPPPREGESPFHSLETALSRETPALAAPTAASSCDALTGLCECPTSSLKGKPCKPQQCETAKSNTVKDVVSCASTPEAGTNRCIGTEGDVVIAKGSTCAGDGPSCAPAQLPLHECRACRRPTPKGDQVVCKKYDSGKRVSLECRFEAGNDGWRALPGSDTCSNATFRTCGTESCFVILNAKAKRNCSTVDRPDLRELECRPVQLASAGDPNDVLNTAFLDAVAALEAVYPSSDIAASVAECTPAATPTPVPVPPVSPDRLPPSTIEPLSIPQAATM